MKNTRIPLLITLLTIPVLVFVNSNSVTATEITPSSTSYTYGPTSEFSNAASISSPTNSPDSAITTSQLANTGGRISLTTILIDGLSLICIGSVVYLSLLMKRKNIQYRLLKR